jgi:hypothetical protein
MITKGDIVVVSSMHQSESVWIVMETPAKENSVVELLSLDASRTFSDFAFNLTKVGDLATIQSIKIL